MKVVDFLSREGVVADLAGKDKKSVLGELAEALAGTGRVPSVSAAVQVLLERERLGSTGIGEGIAIPHGKLKELDEVIAAFGRSREGVDFDSMDGAPVHLFFLLLAPESSASAHLKALARISRLLKDRGFRDDLLRAQGREELFELICREDEKL